MLFCAFNIMIGLVPCFILNILQLSQDQRMSWQKNTQLCPVSGFVCSGEYDFSLPPTDLARLRDKQKIHKDQITEQIMSTDKFCIHCYTACQHLLCRSREIYVMGSSCVICSISKKASREVFLFPCRKSFYNVYKSHMLIIESRKCRKRF